MKTMAKASRVLHFLSASRPCCHSPLTSLRSLSLLVSIPSRYSSSSSSSFSSLFSPPSLPFPRPRHCSFQRNSPSYRLAALTSRAAPPCSRQSEVRTPERLPRRFLATAPRCCFLVGREARSREAHAVVSACGRRRQTPWDNGESSVQTTRRRARQESSTQLSFLGREFFSSTASRSHSASRENGLRRLFGAGEEAFSSSLQSAHSSRPGNQFILAFPAVSAASRCLPGLSVHPSGLCAARRHFSSFLETSARAYLLQPRCTYTAEGAESEGGGSVGAASLTWSSREKEEVPKTTEPPCLQAPADLLPSERPLLSFELYDAVSHNFSCRASEALGDSGNKLPPRYFQWVIDGAAYLLLGGLLAIVLAAPATVVERRIDMHIKTLALTSAMYGGIAFWGFEAARFGRLYVPPAGPTRYLLGFCSLGLCTLPPILCEMFSPAVGYACLTAPLAFHVLAAAYLKRPPSSLFSYWNKAASNLKAQPGRPRLRGPAKLFASSSASPASCPPHHCASQGSTSSGSRASLPSVSRLSVFDVSSLSVHAFPPVGGGFLPQWWGATVSHKCLLGFSLFSAGAGIYVARRVEKTAGDEALADTQERGPQRSFLSTLRALWRGAADTQTEDASAAEADARVVRRAHERLRELAKRTQSNSE
ncbi:putative transmembrane protein [Toxoplasma gondii RUB]|uniref:Putative transmembrane protein n=1 Tax=Toxoplasma gondii RUB TaxID=935652 RepID=A0A086LZQ3_TOXGO|nr:putative transmembrane protein [Toxoplasma gondii RUB]